MKGSITVLGAGSVGVASALHLQQRGWQVTLVDRREPARETSYGNAGVINPASFVPLNSPDLHHSLADLLGNRRAQLRYDWKHVLGNLGWVLAFLKASKTAAATESSRALSGLTMAALDEHRALMQRVGNMHRLTDVGWLKVLRHGKPDPNGFGARLLADCGIHVEHHDPASLAELEPALKPIFSAGYVLPGGGLINNPGELIQEYAAQFVADGGTLVQRDVQGIELGESDLHYRSDDQRYPCEKLLIAAGPWSGDLLTTAGYDIPLQVERGYHAHYTPTGEHKLSRSVHDINAGYVVGPLRDAYRVTTGVELAPRDAPSNLAQLEQVEPRVREAVDIGEQNDDPVWRGNRPTLPDSRPVIGALPDDKRLWLNFGHQHIGLMSGPISGKLLAQLLSNEVTDIDMKPFSPDRHVRRLGRRQRRKMSKESA